MRGMISAYHGLRTYQGKANASMRAVLPTGASIAEEGFTTSLLYQKPNRLRIDFTMPVGGRSVYCDGTTLTYYQNRTQTYSTVPVTVHSLKDVLAELAKLKIASHFDTLYFLAGNDLPATVTGLQRGPDDMRNGRPVYVVKGQERTGAATVTWTWTIDKQTSLLAKVEGRTESTPVSVRVRQGATKGRRTLRVSTVLAQIIVDPQQNSAIDPREFVFHALPTARKIPFNVAMQQQRGFNRAPLATDHPGK
jgi:outer membrane lipoprotein-sorting protein